MDLVSPIVAFDKFDKRSEQESFERRRGSSDLTWAIDFVQQDGEVPGGAG